MKIDDITPQGMVTFIMGIPLDNAFYGDERISEILKICQENKNPDNLITLSKDDFDYLLKTMPPCARFSNWGLAEKGIDNLLLGKFIILTGEE